MNLEIVLTGTELLLGEIVDTNSVMVAKMLRDIGLDIHYKTVVGDNEQRIIDVLNIALSRVDFVLVSGGLGPTVDDRTRQAVAAATQRKLIYSDELEQQIADRFRSFDREMSENNKRQAWIPEGSIPVENPVGTAPCFIVEDERGTIICLPGVPRELKYQMEHAIIPYFKTRMGETQMIKARILRTCAIGESMIDHAIDDLMRLNNPTVGLAAHPGQVDIRITAKAETEAAADQLIAPLEADIRQRLGDYIFGVGQETLAGVVGQMLIDKGLTLSIVDTMVEGALGNDLQIAGYAQQISANRVFATLPEAIKMVGLVTDQSENGLDIARNMAQLQQNNTTIGLSVVGPFPASNDGAQICQVAVAYGDKLETRELRLAYASRERMPWFLTQTLDLLWRMLK